MFLVKRKKNGLKIQCDAKHEKISPFYGAQNISNKNRIVWLWNCFPANILTDL